MRAFTGREKVLLYLFRLKNRSLTTEQLALHKSVVYQP
jgi:hypothetical protein